MPESALLNFPASTVSGIVAGMQFKVERRFNIKAVGADGAEVDYLYDPSGDQVSGVMSNFPSNNPSANTSV